MIVEGQPNNQEEVIDKYLNMNLIFYVITNNKRCRTVVQFSQGLDGRGIGRFHTNPFFDTRDYEIEFADGTQDKYTVNVIPENMYQQVDDESHQFQLLAEIQYHWKEGTAI